MDLRTGASEPRPLHCEIGQDVARDERFDAVHTISLRLPAKPAPTDAEADGEKELDRGKDAEQRHEGARAEMASGEG